jgi:hypothetical protein
MSHSLTHNLREKRMEYAQVMLSILYAPKCNSWHHIVTGNESEFFVNKSPRRMWTLSRDNVAIKPRQQSQSEKFLFMMRCNPIGFYVINRFLNDIKMNRDYFLTNGLISLYQMIFPWRRAPHEKRLVVSVDDCSVHISRGSTDWLEKHGIHLMPDQPYSPNLATSDLYLFSTVKQKLERIHLADEDQFFECLQRVLRSLDRQELNRAFQAWMRRVQEVNEGNGGYVRW